LANAELALLAVMVALPAISRNTFLVDRIGGFFLLAVFAMSVDLIWGYGGLFTFGHAAFFGGAGYMVGILTTREGWILPIPLGWALGAAVLGSALLAIGISYFTFSGKGALRGVEFAVVTLAVAVVLERLANAGGNFTGGQNGILMTVRLGPFHRGYGFYLLAGLLLLGTYLGLKRFLRSRPGLVFRGLGENEERVGLLGYDVPRIKRWTFVLSGAIAGLAGSLFYVHNGIVSPAAVGVGSSTLVLLWVVLGGRGTLIGPVVGAIALPYLTARLSGTLLDTWLVVVGVILVGVILLIPAGVFGFLGKERAT
jgi:branched-chain amino acid transport system permease protein